MTSPARQRARRHEMPDSAAAINEHFHDQGWTDGLPIVPPTVDLVEAMLAHTALSPDAVLGTMPPGGGTATVEKVAANAVMAGCKPEYFPVVLAGVKAVLQPQFNLGGISTTTGGAAPVCIVSGPIAQKLGIHGGGGCMGSGFRANATIGRAIRLTMLNVGGARPDEMDKSTHAWPGKFTCCFAENAEANPWEPLRVNLGYPLDVSTITVVAVRGIHTIAEGEQETAQGILETIAGSMRALGLVNYCHQGRRTPLPVVLGPEHAQEIAAGGFSRNDVRAFLYEHARMPVREIRGRAYWSYRSWPDWFDDTDPDFMVPIVHSPEDFLVVVAGGDGRHSVWMPTWSTTRHATEVIEEA